MTLQQIRLVVAAAIAHFTAVAIYAGPAG